MSAFAVTLRSEWTKLSSLRGTSYKLALAFVLSVGLTGLLALVVGATWDGASVADRAGHDPVGIGLFGSLFSMIVFAVLGATAVTAGVQLGDDAAHADRHAAPRPRARRQGRVSSRR